MIRIVLCDDDVNLHKDVDKVCQDMFPGNYRLCQYVSAEELLDNISGKDGMPDLFLLDIDMPGMDGIELKHILEKYYFQCSIIFLTNHDEMMQKAFGRCVIGFVEKQYMDEQLKDKLMQFRQECTYNTEIKVDDDTMVKIKDIVCIMSEHVYSRIILATGLDEQGAIATKQKCVRYSLKNWIECLGREEFYRIHKTCIINFAYVKQIGQRVVLTDGTEHRVSRNEIRNCREAYYMYCRKRARCI